jgi:hypothetical protein
MAEEKSIARKPLCFVMDRLSLSTSKKINADTLRE